MKMKLVILAQYEHDAVSARPSHLSRFRGSILLSLLTLLVLFRCSPDLAAIASSSMGFRPLPHSPDSTTITSPFTFSAA